jgi:hypothetical protein
MTAFGRNQPVSDTRLSDRYWEKQTLRSSNFENAAPNGWYALESSRLAVLG